MGVEISYPENREWTEFKEKFNNINANETATFYFRLSDYLEDARLFKPRPEEDSENVQICPVGKEFGCYLASILFLKDPNLERLLFYSILIHVVFDIRLPPQISNLAKTIMISTGNTNVLKDIKLPDRICEKLNKNNVKL